MKKVIVTGANGFVGSAVCRELIEQGIEVIAVVRHLDKSVSDLSVSHGLRVVSADLSEFRTLSKRIHDRDVDTLYHFAWTGSAGQLRGNMDIQMKNVKYTCETVKAAAEIGCKRFVFASSIMEYEITKIMETEATPDINTMYCSAKVAANYMARTIAGYLKVDYIRAVISNIYGPGESSPRLINTSLRKMLIGEHCSFSSGNNMYDFIYVTDAVKALVALGKAGKVNRSYYIGSQNPKPLKEFLIEMRDCVDPNIQIGLGEIPFNGASLSYDEFDINAVKEDTGFISEISFKEGIEKTILWLKKTI